jgi:hypothetical protein
MLENAFCTPAIAFSLFYIRMELFSRMAATAMMLVVLSFIDQADIGLQVYSKSY